MNLQDTNNAALHSPRERGPHVTGQSISPPVEPLRFPLSVLEGHPQLAWAR